MKKTLKVLNYIFIVTFITLSIIYLYLKINSAVNVTEIDTGSIRGDEQKRIENYLKNTELIIPLLKINVTVLLISLGVNLAHKWRNAMKERN